MGNVIKIGKRRVEIGVVKIGDSELKLMSMTHGEVNAMSRKESDEDRAAYLIDLIPCLLEGKGGEAVDVCVDDLPEVVLAEIIQRLGDPQNKGNFTAASVP